MNTRTANLLNRKLLLGLVLLTVAIAGIRFSDGTVLLAIASGAGPDNPIFSNPQAQYIWDSPLKIFLLKLLPPTIPAIAFSFTLLGLLPLLGLFSSSFDKKRSACYFSTAILIALTPAIKISLQNIGTGDGLMYVLIVAAVSSTRSLFILLTSVIMAAWHPQQAFFIVGSYCLFSHNFEERDIFRKRAAWSLSGLAIGAIIFFIYKHQLTFAYYDRADYLIDKIFEIPLNNLKHAPISYFYPAFWIYVVHRLVPSQRLTIYSWLWWAILIVIATLTSDVSRVLSIIALPALLIPLQVARQSNGLTSLPLSWVLVSIAFPVYSWSGIDIFLWPALIHDLCSYGILCF